MPGRLGVRRMPTTRQKTADYWKKRFEILENQQNKDAIEFYHNVEKQYDLAIKNIQKELDSWYMRYATNNNVSYADAKKLLTSPELKDFKMDVEEYIKKGKTLNYTDEWAEQLEKASTQFHVDRLQALQMQMQQQIEAVYGNELDSLDTFLANQYKTGYLHTAYEIQKGVGVGFDLMKLDDKKINNLLKQPWTLDAKTFSDRIWNDKKQLVATVDKILTQGTISGQGYEKISKTLMKELNTEYYKAKRIVVTESAFFSSRAQQDCFDDLGVEKYEIVATLDMKTSEICQFMDGKVFEQKRFKPGVTAAPFHCNCRTFQSPSFDDEFEINTKRAARNKDGKTVYIDSNIKYQEWLDKFTKED
jgi:SPP1 gp7 family putative phage head morphogenesis protein